MPEQSPPGSLGPFTPCRRERRQTWDRTQFQKRLGPVGPLRSVGTEALSLGPVARPGGGPQEGAGSPPCRWPEEVLSHADSSCCLSHPLPPAPPASALQQEDPEAWTAEPQPGPGPFSAAAGGQPCPSEPVQAPASFPGATQLGPGQDKGGSPGPAAPHPVCVPHSEQRSSRLRPGGLNPGSAPS